MSRQNGLGIVARAHMASPAVLSLGLVLFAIVIEGRDEFDDLRIHDVKGRLAYRRGGRSRAFNRLVRILLGAAAGPEADEQNESQHHNYSL